MTMIKTEFHLLSSILIRLDEVDPNVFIPLRIMLNNPNTVASAERSFSKLKMIKTFNRSHMINSRLSSLAMSSIETLMCALSRIGRCHKAVVLNLSGLWSPYKDSQHL